eukprot:7764551-Alexandrium_andersonii.AAC.1
MCRGLAPRGRGTWARPTCYAAKLPAHAYTVGWSPGSASTSLAPGRSRATGRATGPGATRNLHALGSLLPARS